MKTQLTLLFLLTTLLSFSQVDLNRFLTLQSAGEIPYDFANVTKDKVIDDKEVNDNLSKKLDEEFKENIHYSIDNMIHSGLCVYGDPISNYISDVAKRLLVNDMELYNKLRFYTLKSNVSNAFSTSQGIIMFTTGLISQFANETQLAYVLAHEIAHYQEKHVLQTFEWKTQNEYNRENIGQFNNYSKEKEFEADNKAIDICLKAGYSANEIYNSFDVLMFSHLPFDEIKFPLDYFNSPLFYVPAKEFTTELYPIKIDEAYDDKNSTHPNVAKRKETIYPLLQKFFGQGAPFMGKEDAFYTMRDYARFESVRTSIIDSDLSKAVYQIFLLEHDHKNNYALTRFKAHTWMRLLQAKMNGQYNTVTLSTKQLEGESAVLHQFIKKLDLTAVAAFTLRIITDGIKLYPESEELKAIRENVYEDLAGKSEWGWTKYSDQNFEKVFESKARQLDSLNAIVPETTTTTTTTTTEVKSKYDRIKGTSSSSNVSAITTVADSSKYYLYGISDLVSSPEFIADMSESRKKIEEIEERENDKKKAKTKKSDLEPLFQNNLMVVEPTTTYYTNKDFSLNKSHSHQLKLMSAMEKIAQSTGVRLHDFSTQKMSEGGTDLFNQRNVLMNYLRQYSDWDELPRFVPVDFELMQNIQQRAGTTKVLFSWTNYNTSLVSALVPPLVGISFPPLIPPFILMGLSKYKTVEYTFLVLDTSDGSVEYGSSRKLRSAGNKLLLKSELYNLFHTKIDKK